MKIQSLQRLLGLWTILLVVVPGLLIMTIYTISQIAIAKQKNLEIINQQVRFQAELIDYWMAERAENVRELSRTSAFRALDGEQMAKALRFKQQSDKNFDSLSYIDRDGFFKFSTLSQGIRFPSARDKPYYETARAGKEYISGIVVGRNSGQAIINFSAPVYDYAGNFQGLILGSIKTATLETIIQANWIGQTGEIILVDRQGTMLTEPRNSSALTARDHIEGTAGMQSKITDDAFRNIRLGESGTAVWADYRGHRVLGAYLDVPDRGWTLIGKIDEAEVLAPLYRQLAIMAGGTGGLVLLMLPLVALITDQIKKPVDWLIEQSDLVAAEDYENVGRAAQPKNMPRELAVFCAAFINMSRKIEKTVGLLKEKEANLAAKVAEIQNINATLEEEVMERQAAQEALRLANEQLEARVASRTEELATANQELLRLSVLDGLTGIANRRYFDQYLEREWLAAIRRGKPLALIIADIDRFKAYNDTYGHQLGDDCLRTVAAALRKSVKRATDLVARYGGEEFAIILPDTDTKGALAAAEKLRSRVEALEIEHKSVPLGHLTISLGVAAALPLPGQPLQALIAMADSALYQAKRAGRNRVEQVEAPT